MTILKEIINFIIKNVIIVWSVIFISLLTLYKLSPTLFSYILSLISLDVDNFDIIESLHNINNENVDKIETINNKNIILENKISKMIQDKIELEEELGRAKGEKAGIIETLKNIKKNNWLIIIISILGVTLVSAIIIYYLFYSNGDGEFFKPIIKHMTSISLNNNDLIDTQFRNLILQLKKIDTKIIDLDEKLCSIKNNIDSLSIDIEKL